MKTLVTPEMAVEMLKGNELNRKPSKRVIGRYARDMLDGSWKYTGDSLKFTEGGRLVDGQHRLLAIIESGTPIWVQVFNDIGDDVFDKIDHGRKRDVGDYFYTQGIANSRSTSAAVRVFDRLRSKRIGSLSGGLVIASEVELLDIYNEVTDKVLLINFGAKFYGVAPSIVNGCMLYCLWLNESALVVDYFKELSDGLGRDGFGQARVVRNWFIRSLTDKRLRPTKAESLEKILKGFKNLKEGKSPDLIPLKGISPKTFPYDCNHPE